MRLERLTDNSNALSLREQRQLEVVLDDFERSFPQCFFAVYLGVLPTMITARDLGFWLINHGAFHTQQIAKRNDFGCALVIDSQRGIAALTLGYALEPYVSEADVTLLLEQVRSPLIRQLYGLAVERAVAIFGKKLSQSASSASLDGGMISSPTDLNGLGLQTLRNAHRSSRPMTKH
ncbi:hypothetical protein GCM10023213_34530 [Prosthecobacter algae]|uniref:TPM domain-containing protein n=1 Tax=Prosthecobacter algae TaxID=1144682 RepID=A0ABP9PFU2_9BACT